MKKCSEVFNYFHMELQYFFLDSLCLSIGDVKLMSFFFRTIIASDKGEGVCTNSKKVHGKLFAGFLPKILLRFIIGDQLLFFEQLNLLHFNHYN